jgi:hypothetical protein
MGHCGVLRGRARAILTPAAQLWMERGAPGFVAARLIFMRFLVFSLLVCGVPVCAQTDFDLQKARFKRRAWTP